MNLSPARRPARPLPRVRFARRALATALAAAFSHAPETAWAQALPTGLNIASGTADIESSSGRMVIRNSPNAILNWQSFSIGQPNTVIFLQDNANSKVLNRVVGNDPSNILGSLSSNGQVWLVNPNGVMFGQNAQVNVGALVASTLGISNENFLAGRYAFGADGVPGGLVQNYGNLNASGDNTTSMRGHIWLIGGSVRNEPDGYAQTGQIVLAAGQSVDLVDSGVPNVTVRVSASGNEVVNLGRLLSPAGGSIDLHGAIVNQSGIVRATSFDTSKAGRILIHAVGNAFLGQGSETNASGDGNAAGGQVVVKSDGGTTSAQGEVLATSAYYGGGQIQLLGPTVRVDYGANVDASGADSGGEVLIGTPQLAADPAVINSRNVLVNVETQVKASATRSGNGGSIVVRSDGTTDVSGSLEARAGENGGGGGMVETSGAVVRGRPASIDVSGTEGSSGTWRLKANDIAVVADDCGSSCPTVAPQQTIVSSTLVQDTLAQGAHVRMEAGGNLAVNADIGTGAQLPGARLTLAANNDVTVGSRVNIGSTGNPMPVSLLADFDGSGSGAIVLDPDARIMTAGADLRLAGGTGNSLAQGISLQASTLDAGSGNLYMYGSTLSNTGESVLKGNFIAMSGRTLALSNLVVDATAYGGTNSGSIGITADTVAFTGARLNADNKVDVIGSSAISLDNSFVSAGAAGDAIRLSTNSLSARASGLGTPNGRWLTYLNNTSTFSPSAFQSLGYTFVQVGTGMSAPAPSGPGQNGVIVSAPLDVLVNVDATRVYDGTTRASFSTALDSDLAPAFTLQARDGVVVHGQFADKNAGAGKAIFLDDASAAFAITTSTGQPVYGAHQTYVADITPKSITASLTGASKVYDGTRAATVSGTLAGTVTGDDVRLDGAAGLFDTKDAGTGKPITLTGNPLSGADAGNYSLEAGSRAVADITPRSISLAGLTALDKVYDGTRVAALSGSLTGILPGDAVSVDGATGQFADKNAGAGKTVTISGAALAGADAGNYALNGSATVRASITPRPISLTGMTALDKVYDGTRAATVSGSLTDVLSGDAVSVNGATGQFADKNAGTGKTVSISGAALAGDDAGNYALNGSATVQASITQRQLTLAGLTALDKVYDGTRAATVSGSLANVLPGDAVSVSAATGQFADKNAGTAKTVSISGAALAGADAGNYAVNGSTTVQASITPRPISLTGMTALDKVYDGTRAATVSGSLADVLPGDTVSASGATGQFADKNAGTGKTVSISAAALAGDDAGNYALNGPTTVQASITPRQLTLAGLTALDKVYDGTRVATLSGSLADVLAGDSVSLNGATGQFADKNAGTGKTVSISGAALAGADASNYTLNGAATVQASITPRPIAFTGLTALDKVYDGTRTATLSGSLTDILAGDAVSLDGATAQFADKNAGTRKAVAISGATLGGADAGNYALAGANDLRASITPRAITFAGLTALDKIYDGTLNATVSGSLADVLAGDQVSVGDAGAQFADKNAGIGKTVSISGGALAGADAGNYAVSGTVTVQASITPRQLALTGMTALDKVYDGTRTAVVSASITGALPGEVVSLNTAGQFDTKNVGAAKTVAITGALGGADAANYTVSLPASTSAAVTARPLEIVLTGDVRKEYDATAQASLAPDGFRLDGVIAGDAVAIRGPAQGSFASPDVGRSKPVSASGAFEISGADASNYRVGATALTGTASTVQATVSANVGTITPATLVYEASPATSVGGLSTAPLGGTVTGFKGGDSLDNATSGTLQWNGTATPASGPGTYAVYGSGLSAANYQFVQAAGNATALELKASLPASAPQQRAQDESAQATKVAMQAATPATVSAATVQVVSNAVFDRSTESPAKTFAAVRIESMNQDELGRLIAYRKSFKRKLFADAIYKLDIDPSLADVRPCNTAAEAASGTCRITPAQVAALQATVAQAAASANSATAPHGTRARVVNLPKIERKIAVLFGINDYTDKNIPQLENAVPDADAVGKVFAEKLGYEVRVVRNADKATIVRTLNELAAEAGSADSVAIYYAGHGISMNKNGAGYWLASDASVTDPKGWISNADVARLLSGIRSKQVTLISDSCYSGAFAREGLSAIGQHVAADDVLAKRSVVVLSSGGDEPVPDEGKDGHSIFAWYLMQVIGSVTDWKQGSTIFSDVQAQVRKEFPQTPRYGSLTAAGHQAGGDYLFESRSN